MNTATAKYGVEEVDIELAPGMTIGQVIDRARAALGCGDSVKGLVNGIEMPMEAVVQASRSMRVPR